MCGCFIASWINLYLAMLPFFLSFIKNVMEKSMLLNIELDIMEHCNRHT